MKAKKRQNREISAGAMADIAFLLLVFFFVCTNIVEDEGILVQLPPYEVENPPPIPAKNVFNLLVNADNQIMAEGKEMKISQLPFALKNFILNPNKLPDLPNKPSKAIISFQCDQGTEYDSYILVYDQLKKVYNELWEEKAQTDFRISYAMLSKKDQKQVRSEIPLLISEAETKDFVNADGN